MWQVQVGSFLQGVPLFSPLSPKSLGQSWGMSQENLSLRRIDCRCVSPWLRRGTICYGLSGAIFHPELKGVADDVHGLLATAWEMLLGERPLQCELAARYSAHNVIEEFAVGSITHDKAFFVVSIASTAVPPRLGKVRLQIRCM